jgi:hypothetical protein
MTHRIGTSKRDLACLAQQPAFAPRPPKRSYAVYKSELALGGEVRFSPSAQPINGWYLGFDLYCALRSPSLGGQG